MRLDAYMKAAIDETKADLAILDVNVLDVCTKEVFEASVAVKADRIIRVGDVKDLVGSATRVVDVKGLYLSPGFIDAHIHIESSLLTVRGFARAALPHGTTTVIIDPHEIANVLGVAGVKLFLEESADLPLKVFVMAPSCVPAAPGFETSGAKLTATDTEKLLRIQRVIGLAEVMGYLDVIHRNPVVLRKVEAARSMGKRVDGHAPALIGRELGAYLSAGIHSDHECVTAEEALEKLRLGVWIMAREGSAAKNLRNIIKGIRRKKLDTRRVMLATDDLNPIDLSEGHINKLVREVISEGYDPITAIQMATINPATYFHLDHEIGIIGPGFKADMVLLENLEKVTVSAVFADGKLVSKKEKLTTMIPAWKYPPYTRRTIRIRALPKPADFAIQAPRGKRKVTARVIGVEDCSLLTTSETETLPVKNSRVGSDVEKDVLHAAVVERHKATGNIGLGFVRGFKLLEGALASSVAHDSHNIVVVGANWSDMAVAVEKIAEIGGGMVAVRGGRVLASLSLPVAGIISEDPVGAVSRRLRELHETAETLGCRLAEPFMTMSFIALPVIPELKLTDMGLIEHMKFVNPVIA